MVIVVYLGCAEAGPIFRPVGVLGLDEAEQTSQRDK